MWQNTICGLCCTGSGVFVRAQWVYHGLGKKVLQVCWQL